jgi:regulatory protein
MQRDLEEKLMQRAGRILARRAYSRASLRLKLLRLAPEETTESVLNRLQHLNLLNDADYAYNFAFNRIRDAGWGPLRVRRELSRRMVAADVIESAIDRVGEEFTEPKALEKYLDRYWCKVEPPRDIKAVQRLINHLRRRGFDYSVIREVLHNRLPGNSGSWSGMGE